MDLEVQECCSHEFLVDDFDFGFVLRHCTFRFGQRFLHFLRNDGTMINYLDLFEADDLLIAATRYYLGRMTASTCYFAENLALAWNCIPENVQNILKRDIEAEFKLDDRAREENWSKKPLGMDCDRAAWEKVRTEYNKTST